MITQFRKQIHRGTLLVSLFLKQRSTSTYFPLSCSASASRWAMQCYLHPLNLQDQLDIPRTFTGLRSVIVSERMLAGKAQEREWNHETEELPSSPNSQPNPTYVAPPVLPWERRGGVTFMLLWANGHTEAGKVIMQQNNFSFSKKLMHRDKVQMW